MSKHTKYYKQGLIAIYHNKSINTIQQEKESNCTWHISPTTNVQTKIKTTKLKKNMLLINYQIFS